MDLVRVSSGDVGNRGGHAGGLVEELLSGRADPLQHGDEDGADLVAGTAVLGVPAPLQLPHADPRASSARRQGLAQGVGQALGRHSRHDLVPDQLHIDDRHGTQRYRCRSPARACLEPTERGSAPTMKIRVAVPDDAPDLGRVMVESFLSAHRGQMPDAAWQKRVDEWTPDVSARGWARALTEQAEGNDARDVLLVAEDENGVLSGLVSGTTADADPTGSVAEIGALYVLPDRHRRGIGRALLRAAASELANRGFSALHLEVLTANLPARAFYEAMGGREIGQGTTDEEGYLLPVTVYGWPDITSLSVESERPCS
jgi:ribosomal protein S18 acetylase RimI-like enzyme